MIQSRLTQLPYELIEMIAEASVNSFRRSAMWGQAHELDALASLSRTCKQLEQDCASTLYKTVVLTDRTKAMQFLQTIRRKPSLAAKVRTCYIRMHSKPYDDQTDAKLFESLQPMLALDGIPTNMFLEENRSEWQAANALVILILQRLSCLQKLSAGWEALSLATHWPEEYRLLGKSLSVLVIDFDVQSRYHPSGPYGGHRWFDWVSAFKPDHLPSGDVSLKLNSAEAEYICDSDDSDCSLADQELDAHARDMLASLRRISLTDCTDSMMATWQPLAHCPNVEHLTLGTSYKFPLQWMIQNLSVISHLKIRLKELCFYCACYEEEDTFNVNALQPLSDFTALTSLEMPVINIHPKDANVSITWPPALESLTIEWNFHSTPHFIGAIAHAMQANDIPAGFKTITIDWTTFLQMDEGLDAVLMQVIHFVYALNEKCQAHHITLRHQDNEREGSSAFVSLKFLRNFVAQLLYSASDDSDYSDWDYFDSDCERF